MNQSAQIEMLAQEVAKLRNEVDALEAKYARMQAAVLELSLTMAEIVAPVLRAVGEQELANTMLREADMVKAWMQSRGIDVKASETH